jgi:hypothetical protein
MREEAGLDIHSEMAAGNLLRGAVDAVGHPVGVA